MVKTIFSENGLARAESEKPIVVVSATVVGPEIPASVVDPTVTVAFAADPKVSPAAPNNAKARKRIRHPLPDTKSATRHVNQNLTIRSTAKQPICGDAPFKLKCARAPRTGELAVAAAPTSIDRGFSGQC